MITVSLSKSELRVAGHSDTAPKGEDIVCASVSVLAHALLYGFEKILKIPVSVGEMQPGSLSASWDPEALGSGGTILLETVQGSIAEIAKKYSCVKLTGFKGD